MALNIKPQAPKSPLPNFDGRRTKTAGNPSFDTALKMTGSLSNLNSSQRSYLAREFDNAGALTGDKAKDILDKAVKDNKISPRKAREIGDKIGVKKYW